MDNYGQVTHMPMPMPYNPQPYPYTSDGRNEDVSSRPSSYGINFHDFNLHQEVPPAPPVHQDDGEEQTHSADPNYSDGRGQVQQDSGLNSNTQDGQATKPERSAFQTEEKHVPPLSTRIMQLASFRIRQSKYTMIFSFLVLLSALICIVLQAIILSAHLQEANDVLMTDNATFNNQRWAHRNNVTATDSIGPSGPFNATNSNDPFVFLEDSLVRVENENIFFIVFQAFMVYYGIDSIVRQNLIQLIAYTVLEFFCAVFAFVETLETKRWLDSINGINAQYGTNADGTHLSFAMSFEIALLIIMFVFSLIFGYLAWQLSKEFGWIVYKRIGADVQLQNIYRQYQAFILLCKLDAFFGFIFSLFWLISIGQQGYATSSPALQAFFAIHLILTVLFIPAMFFGRRGVIIESRLFMSIFILFVLILIGDFIVIFEQSTKQSTNQWVFWVLIVIVAIILLVITTVYAVIVTRNFNKGLAPFIQRLFDERYKEHLEGGVGLGSKHGGHTAMTIDDMEDPSTLSKRNSLIDPKRRKSWRLGRHRGKNSTPTPRSTATAPQGTMDSTASQTYNQEFNLGLRRVETPTEVDE
ncbi:hypothetical protein BZG36_03780 [Bifiguratus adelaidae]|uniref:TRP C-terminal domain-containing protein n=1 Tax=Bifiguratus adelaidae TaxID=1938954 RepID=A0A261XXK8_9FUNG|nr:hypothetical protein BZG36_03780 [Bifiguratus adelaidae]